MPARSQCFFTPEMYADRVSEKSSRSGSEIQIRDCNRTAVSPRSTIRTVGAGRLVDVVPVANPEDIGDAQAFVAHPVGDYRDRKLCVRHRHRLVVEGADAGHPETDVVGVEVLVLNDEDAGDEIRADILCGEPGSQRQCRDDELADLIEQLAVHLGESWKPW